VPFCGGPLYAASYLRKPRGGPPDLPEAYAVRFSLCCGQPGCRPRVLPPSVLFWGRRVYWAAVFWVVPALRQGRTRGYTVRRLQALFGLTRPTLARWCRYFREQFAHSRDFQSIRGRLLPPVAVTKLPGSLIERFQQARGDHQATLIACLRALSLNP
jgi:hypothetical protein